MKYFALFVLGIVAVQCDVSSLFQKFATGNYGFTTDLYSEMKQVHDKNFVYSPLSAEIILALTRIGAKGNTAQQMSQGLHLPEDTHEIQEMFEHITPTLKSADGYNLESANRIYLKHGYQIREDFKQIAEKSFEADVKSVNFDMAKEAANEINHWVSEKTHDKIKDLIDYKMFTDDTRAVLVNALYFKSSWVTKFNEHSTKQKTFYLTRNDHVKVDMMEMTNNFRYRSSQELKAKVLEMPYVGGEYSMVFVLPDDTEGLHELESNMDTVLNMERGIPSQVHVQIPKFKMESSIDLSKMLRNLGIKDAFEDYADFSGISAPGELPLKISDVIQKAIIEVDEKGTTAAASTAVHAVNTYSLHIPTVIYEFNADHPFIFYIKGPSGVMFIGRYVQK